MQTKRLIDANELKELRYKYIRGEIHFDDEQDMIDRCPTVDAEFVVRCKDCAFSQSDGWVCGGTALMLHHRTFPDSFCSDGKKKDLYPE